MATPIRHHAHAAAHYRGYPMTVKPWDVALPIRWECPQCGKTYRHRGWLDRHDADKHPPVPLRERFLDWLFG